MVKLLYKESLEDIYEKTYLIIRFFIKNTTRLKINKKFIRSSFMNTETFFFLKNLILRIKKSLYFFKNFPSFENTSTSMGLNHNKKNLKQTDMIFITKIDPFFKVVNAVLKFTEKCKKVSLTNNTSWCFKKFYSNFPKQELFLANLFLRKVVLKFLNSYSTEDCELNVDGINKIIFLIHSFEYKNIYNFF